MRDRYHRRSGFTLIEIMISVVIIGILAAIAIPNFIEVRNRAHEARVKAAAHALHVIVEEYAATNEGTMPALGDLTPALFPGGVYPPNPFTGAPIAIGATGAYSQGNLGYNLAGASIYTIEGYGEEATSGPTGNGIVITLGNG